VTAVDGGQLGDHDLPGDEAARQLFGDLPDDERDRILDPRDQKVLRLKWGLEDGREYHNREIGLELRVGDERVRQIYVLAVRKMIEGAAGGRGSDGG
jgi:RNA polymerase primary sigma factor